MVTGSVGCYRTAPRASVAPRIAALVAGVALLSGCATRGAVVGGAPSEETRRAACDDFARGEVARLGESVPAALAKGFLMGLAWDLDQIISPAASYFDGSYAPGLRYRVVSVGHAASPPGDDGPLAVHGRVGPVRYTLRPVGASVIGGPMLARDAARTNDEVRAQALERCTAPARLAREFGPTDARVATSLEALADAYMRQREPAQAEPLRREVVVIWTALFGPIDSTVARAIDEHAAALRLLHRNVEADSQSARAAAIRAELAARLARRPLDIPRRSMPEPCASPAHASVFVMCRHAPPVPDTEASVLVARP
jgi:hypothetical protein